ncbi:uncharacterized protein Dvar_72220 [Desulfosarcina variabilis str. Montpellier]|uniref:hypothetical protein n=1 Tax=Desulfosarcina variabilis TaxID=2300 RepID=UPI003AFA20EB
MATSSEVNNLYNFWDKVTGEGDCVLLEEEIGNFDEFTNSDEGIKEQASKFKLLLFDANGNLTELGKNIAAQDGEDGISWSDLMQLDGFDGSERDCYISNSELLSFRDSNNSGGDDTAPTDDSDDTAPTDDSDDTAPTDDSDDTAPTDDSDDTAPTDDSDDTAPTDDSDDTAPTDDSDDTASTDDSDDDTRASEYENTYNDADDNNNGISFHGDENQDYMDSWYIHGDGGDDSITLQTNTEGGQLEVENSLIEGNDGNDLIIADTVRASTVDGGTGADVIAITCAEGSSNIAGGEGVDEINVTQLVNSTVAGGGGNDNIAVGFAASDEGSTSDVDGGAGDDYIDLSIYNLEGRVASLVNGTIPTFTGNVHGGEGENDTVRLQGASGDYKIQAHQITTDNGGTHTIDYTDYIQRQTGDVIRVYADVENVEFTVSNTGLTTDGVPSYGVNAGAQAKLNHREPGSGFEANKSYTLFKERNLEMVATITAHGRIGSQRIYAYSDDGKRISIVDGNKVFQGTRNNEGIYVWEDGIDLSETPIELADGSTVGIEARPGDQPNPVIHTNGGYTIYEKANVNWEDLIIIDVGDQGTMADGVAPGGILGARLNGQGDSEQAQPANNLWQTPAWMNTPEFQNA